MGRYSTTSVPKNAEKYVERVIALIEAGAEYENIICEVIHYDCVELFEALDKQPNFALDEKYKPGTKIRKYLDSKNV